MTGPGTLDDLRRAYPQWAIEHGASGLPVYTAELVTRGGASLHYLVAHDLDQLAAKLEAAEDETGAAGGRTNGEGTQ